MSRPEKPISPGFFGYSVLRNSVLSDWYKDLLALCEAMDMGIEGLHTETGAGVLEAALRVDDALAATDKAALFKLFTKVLAQKRGWLATFMAKWSKDWPGCGGHMHMSLWKGGKLLWALIAGTVSLGGLVLLLPPLQRLFSLGPLSVSDVALCLLLAVGSVVWFEPVKLVLRKQLRQVTRRNQ